MASDHVVELGRLGHVHVERKAVVARNPPRFTKAQLVEDPGQKRPDGQAQATALRSVPASGEASDPLSLLSCGLAEPWVEMTRLGGACDGTANSAVAKGTERCVLDIRGSVRRHEDVFDQARVAVLDVFDATE